MPRKRKEHVITRTRGAARLLPLARRLARQLKRDSFRTWTFSRGSIKIRQTDNHIWYHLEAGEPPECTQSPVFFIVRPTVSPDYGTGSPIVTYTYEGAPFTVYRYWPDRAEPPVEVGDAPRFEQLPDLSPPGFGNVGGNAQSSFGFSWAGGVLMAIQTTSLGLFNSAPQIGVPCILEVDPDTGDYFWTYLPTVNPHNQVLAEWFDDILLTANQGFRDTYPTATPPWQPAGDPPGWYLDSGCAPNTYAMHTYSPIVAYDGLYSYGVVLGDIFGSGCNFGLRFYPSMQLAKRQYVDFNVGLGEFETIDFAWTMIDYRAALPTGLVFPFAGQGLPWTLPFKQGRYFAAPDGGFQHWVGRWDFQPGASYGTSTFDYAIAPQVISGGYEIYSTDSFLVDWNHEWHAVNLWTWSTDATPPFGGDPTNAWPPYTYDDGYAPDPFPTIIYGKVALDGTRDVPTFKQYKVTSGDLLVSRDRIDPSTGPAGLPEHLGVTIWAADGVTRIQDGHPGSIRAWNYSVHDGSFDTFSENIRFNWAIECSNLWRVPLSQDYRDANPTVKEMWGWSVVYKEEGGVYSTFSQSRWIYRILVTGAAGDPDDWEITSFQPVFHANAAEGLSMRTCGKISPWIMVSSGYHWTSSDSVAANIAHFRGIVDNSEPEQFIFAYNMETGEYRDVHNDYNLLSPTDYGFQIDFGPVVCPNVMMNY